MLLPQKFVFVVVLLKLLKILMQLTKAILQPWHKCFFDLTINFNNKEVSTSNIKMC